MGGGGRFQVPCSNFFKDFFGIKCAAGMGVVGRGSGFCRCNLNRDTRHNIILMPGTCFKQKIFFFA